MNNAAKPPLPLLTVEDVAKFIGSSTKTVRRLIETGDLPHVRIGRLVRIHPMDLERFVQARRS